MFEAGRAGVFDRWGRSHCADGTSPTAGNCVACTATRHEPPRLDRDVVQGAHDGSVAGGVLAFRDR